MEFGEKLQELRKKKGLTQEELAEALYVSRTAVSKWELGRGYPNIDSLKEISKFFSVSIDELLSGEKLLSIAEKENKSNIKNMCDLLFGIVDLFSLILIILPLYPNTIGDFVYSVNLLNYAQTSQFNKTICWVGFISLVLKGFVEGIPDSVLSGGQYDRLMAKMGRKSRAMGFAVYMDALEMLESPAAYDVDTVLLYSEADPPAAVRAKAEALMAQGKRVLVQRSVPEHIRCKEVLKM